MQDKKFSIICPIYDKGYETLDKFILNLREQDYKNYEVIFVVNSPDPKTLKVMKKTEFKVPNQIIDIGYKPSLKNGNHCRAFNEGAKLATGDYLLFLDPDVYLLPGILREYKDAFDKNDVDFVYGDYDLIGGHRVQGRPYNEYELRCANYISGGFPIKKKAFQGWDEKIQSLQDWDMWLSAVDKGAKGFYIGGPGFLTEMPTKKGISSNQAANWKKRYSQVRNKHKFPVSKVAVTSLGAPLHATKVAKVLGVDTRVLSNIVNFKPHDYETIYLLGFYPEGWQGHMALFYEQGNLKGRLASKNRIIHWIGTDIYNMYHKLSYVALRNIVTFLNDPEFNFTHLTECEATQAELKEIGIESEVVPLPVQLIELSPLPKKFTVANYINNTQNMYNQELMEEVADAMPDIDFKFFGDANAVKKDKNKEYVGWVDMKEFLPKVSALTRFTTHDGLPIGPIEAMMAGRNILTNVDMPFVQFTDNLSKENIIEEIRKLQKLEQNVAGSLYWQNETSPELYKKRMEKYLV